MLHPEWAQPAPALWSGCMPGKGDTVHAGLARCMGARRQLCHLPWVLVRENQ